MPMQAFHSGETSSGSPDQDMDTSAEISLNNAPLGETMRVTYEDPESRAAKRSLMKLIGAKLEAMITRILGVILAALAVQFVLDGLERSLPGLAG